MEWQRIIGRVAGTVERRLVRGKRTLLRGIYGDRPARVVGYRGYGNGQVAHLRGRVLFGPPLPAAAAEDQWWRNLVHAYRRLESDEVAGARLRVRFEDTDREVIADEEGHFHVELKLPEAPDPSSYWHEAHVDLLEPDGRGATVPVAVPRDPIFGVISDLDDTVLQTDVRNVLRMAREILFGNAHTRIPFPGVGAFYRALHADRNPLFYVSSSPWNLYDVLSQFLHLHRIPAGPMDLRDWVVATSSGKVLPTGHHGHKRAAIDRILETYPGLPFILVGDSGQEDPEIYRSVVHDHPDRVLAIYIRSVHPDPGRIEAVELLAREIVGHGIDLVLVHDTVEAARHAAGMGWIDSAAVESVGRDRAREVAEYSGPNAAGDPPGPDR